MTRCLNPFLLHLSLVLVVILAIPSPSVAASKDEDAKAGAILFRDKGCAYCHGADAAGTKKGPSLLELAKNKTWTNAKITDQVLNGGRKMPPFRDSLTDEEVGHLIAYLRTKNKPVPPPPSSDGSAPTPSPQ